MRIRTLFTPVFLLQAACAVFSILLSVTPLISQTVTRLADVRKIYVEKMDKNLDEDLRAEIGRAFPNSISVVLDKKKADAVLTQIKIDPLDIHTITVNLTDAGGVAVLWSGSASDRDLMFGGLKKSGAEKIAQHLVKELKKAMHR